MRYRSSKANFVHEAECAAARGLGKPNTLGLKLGERVGRQALRAELDFDGRDEVDAERAEIRAAYACPEDREQRAGVGEQDALLSVDPEQVQVPVVIGRREFAERD